MCQILCLCVLGVKQQMENYFKKLIMKNKYYYQCEQVLKVLTEINESAANYLEENMQGPTDKPMFDLYFCLVNGICNSCEIIQAMLKYETTICLCCLKENIRTSIRASTRYLVIETEIGVDEKIRLEKYVDMLKEARNIIAKIIPAGLKSCFNIPNPIYKEEKK